MSQDPHEDVITAERAYRDAQIAYAEACRLLAYHLARAIVYPHNPHDITYDEAAARRTERAAWLGTAERAYIRAVIDEHRAMLTEEARRG